MQHTNHSNTVIGDAEINHMPAYTATAIAFADGFAGHALLRIVGELIEDGGHFIGVAVRLLATSLLQCVQPNTFKIAQCSWC
jgi:hypothetical protein